MRLLTASALQIYVPFRILPKHSEAWAETEALFTLFCGGTLDKELLRKMSPIYYVQEGKSFVPFLIAHGDADTAVDFSQSAELVKRLGGMRRPM